MNLNASQSEDGDLPKGWVWATLGEIRSEHRKIISPNNWPDKVFELYSVPSFESRIPEAISGKEIGSSKQVVDVDTVLLCKINPRINRVWVVGGRKDAPKIASTEWIPFAKFDSILPKYLCYFMKNNRFRDFLASNVSGVGGSLMRVNENTFAEYPFPLCSFNEQKRIVAKIEELFTRLDAGVEALKKVKAELKRYRQAVLKYAFEGKLTAEWRKKNKDKLEPASKPLERIAKEREKNSKGKTKKLPPLDMSELPELPDCWAYAFIRCLLSTSRPGMKTGPFGTMLKKHEHKLNGVPVLGIENIGAMNFVPGSKIHITQGKANQLSTYDVLPGDVLISRSGTVGEVCVVPEGIGEARFSTNIMRVTLSQIVMLPEYFGFLFIGCPFALSQVSDLCKGSTRNFLNQRILSSIIFPVPPIQEQQQIVAEIDRHFSVTDEVEQTIEKSLKEADRLRQSILKKAFEGKLVPQDPTDEPAEKLLERIKAEKEKIKTDVKKTKPIIAKKVKG